MRYAFAHGPRLAADDDRRDCAVLPRPARTAGRLTRFASFGVMAMPLRCLPDPANTYIDALSMWGQLCCLETMLKSRHLPLEAEMVTTCKEICHRLMEHKPAIAGTTKTSHTS